MKWSYRLGEFFGIDVRLHVSFLLLLAWIGFGTYSDTGSAAATVVSVLFVVALFAFVVMHEYGHALTARAFGVRTRHITLYPIGGVAMLERMPEKPSQQLLIALAGPAVNFALAALIALGMVAFGTSPLEADYTSVSLGGAVSALFWANIVMGTFNLIPATPMDGGRVLKAALSLRMDSLRATRIATRIARVVAVAMGILALKAPTNLVLLAIALFVWFAAGAERAMEERMGRARQMLGERGSLAGGPNPYQGPVIIEGGPDAPGQRFAVRVVDGPFGPRYLLTRIG